MEDHSNPVIDLTSSGDEADTTGYRDGGAASTSIAAAQLAGVDLASWQLIQKLQQQDENEGRKMDASKMSSVDDDMVLARRMAAAERASAENTHKHDQVSSMEDVLQSLAKCQRDALQQARRKHEAALPNVRKRIVSMGYKGEDLDNCLAYIRDEAPIIIHLNEQCLSFLAKPEETHYRNLFEVHKSGGSANTAGRKGWERNMFGHYYDRATPFQRVKYGCLNFTGDIEGVTPARCYGNFYMSLKPAVRHRCTFFNMDTASFSSGGSSFLGGLGGGGTYGRGGSDALATARNYCHILEKYNDTELHSILALNKIGGGKSKCVMYKEVQIHGPVCLATDIEALSIPGKEKDASSTLMNMVKRFQKKSNCSLLWQADLLGYESSSQQLGVGMHAGLVGMAAAAFPAAGTGSGLSDMLGGDGTFGGSFGDPSAVATIPFSAVGTFLVEVIVEAVVHVVDTRAEDIHLMAILLMLEVEGGGGSFHVQTVVIEKAYLVLEVICK